MSKKKYTSRPVTSRQYGQKPGKGKASPKTVVIISVCAIVLGVLMTAQDYLDRHTQASIDAQAVMAEALAEVSAAVPDYAEDVLAAGSSESGAAAELKKAAETLTSGSLNERSEAYRAIASALEAQTKVKSAASAKALSEAMSAAEDTAVAYNKEAQALNEKIGKFPYNIVAKIGGYVDFPIFVLSE